MKIAIVTPRATTTRTGNRHTAQRYGAFLRAAGHRVRTADAWDGHDIDLLIALHARKSHVAIAQFRERLPDRPLILVLTGTDLYRDIHIDASAQASLDLATLLVVLQDEGSRELPSRRAPEGSCDLSVGRATSAAHGQYVGDFAWRARSFARGERSVSQRACARLFAGCGDIEVVQVGRCARRPNMARAARAMDAIRAALSMARQCAARARPRLACPQPAAGRELAHGRRRERDLRGGAHRRSGRRLARVRAMSACWAATIPAITR